ncbi:GTPase activating protein (GAP) [Coemansia sp. RSA 552]|nr:GTPase activating protein (GAP) [Coemansia sp. RSA 552]
MFVLPAPTEPSAFWSNVQHTENFVLQQSVSTGSGAFLKSVLATIQNVLETKPPAYRIIYRHEAQAINYILLAVGEERGEIDADWRWLADNIMPVVAQLDEVAERANFVVTKIRFLVTAEDGQQEGTADRKMRAALTTFRQTFNVGKAESLVTYYSCALQSNFMVYQGWLYLSENYFCFYAYMFGAEKKIMLALRDIKDLTKARSMGGARDDAIEVAAKDGARFVFSNLFHRDETFDMLEQLTQNTMKRMLLNSEYATASTSSAQPQTSQAPRPVSSSQQHSGNGGGGSLAERIARQRRDEEFRGEFGLPGGESLLSVIDTASYTPQGTSSSSSPQVFRGRLYLSTSFVCFVAPDHRGCRITLPLAAVRRIERANALDHYGLRCYELTITVWHQMAVAFHVPLRNNECNRWCDALRQQLRRMVDEQQQAKTTHTPLARYTLKAFCRTCVSEYLLDGKEPSISRLGTTFGFPGDEKQLKEHAKRKHWIKYMEENGRNLTAVRRSEFDRLIRVGLPNALRAEMWELSSGSMYLRFQNRGVYERYVNEYLDSPGPCADEIEKDLARSLPEYPGFQVPEGIDALRRVLNAYSLRDAELGYCQAMNIVASTMLIFMTEEQVFWALSVMCERMVPGYYSQSMYGASLDQSIFQALVEETMPMLANSLQRHDIQLSIACLPWFLTLFVNSMPLVYALRVLDCFFLEGPKILFRIALSILKINGGELMDAADDGAFLFVLKQYFSTLGDPAYPDSKNARAREVTKFHELLYMAYSDFPTITHERIEELRRSHQLRIVHSVEEFSKRTFLRSVIDPGGFTKEQLSLLYDRYYSVLFYKRRATADDADGERITLGVYAFARFMYEISSWMRVQITEARERIRSHRNVDIADIQQQQRKQQLHGRPEQSKTDEITREIAASLENPGWFITSLFRYTSRIVPPRSRAALDSDTINSNASEPLSATEPQSATEPHVEDRYVSFQQCVIALGRIVNTDLLTRMDVFFDMYAETAPGSISRQEMFQLSEAILYIGHGEDVETGRRDVVNGDITNEENLLRSVSDFLRRAVTYGEGAADASGGEFALGRNLFRVVVLEDETLEHFFADIVPVSFRFTDGVELANPKRAISTHLPASPLATRSAESAVSAASARLLAGGRSVAEGMSMRVAQTIALGSQFVDQRVLTPIVRNAAAAQLEGLRERTQGSHVDRQGATIDELPDAESLDGMSEKGEPDEEIAEHMVQLSLRSDNAEPAASPKAPSSPGSKDSWAEAPQQPFVNAPHDPYDNLLDEVDQLLDEMTDGDKDAPKERASKSSIADLDLELDEDMKPAAQPQKLKDLDFEVDEDDNDGDSLTHLPKDK